MKFHVTTVPLVAAAFLLLQIGDVRSFNLSHLPRETGASGVPFVIYVPDNPPETFIQKQPETSPNELQTTNNRGVTVVEIVRSVEVKLNGSNELNAETASDNGDLLFSDTNSKTKAKESSRHITQGNKHNTLKYRRLEGSALHPLTSIEGNDKNKQSDWKYASEGIFGKHLISGGLDFNSRILLGNVLVRKSNNGIDDSKYIYLSDAKVSDNKYHATYINHNSSTALKKSRINVRFPPKMFPLGTVNAQQNRPNNTNITSNRISQSQKALYRSRIGKAKIIQNTENENKQNSSEATPTKIVQTQDRRGRLQALTHWDFGKKTPNTPSDEGSYAPTFGISTTPSIDQISSDVATDLPHLVHPTRSKMQPLEVTTTNAMAENEIKRQVEPQVIPQNSFPKHQTFPIYSNINSIQTLPVVQPVHNIKSTNPSQVIHTHNGNVIRQNLRPHMFPDTHVQDYSNDIRNENVEDSNTMTYSSQATAQNYIPVINIVQQSEQQDGVRSFLRPVYFVPHAALQLQRQFPAVVALQTADNGGATHSVPIIVQQQNSPYLYQAGFHTSPALPAPNRVVYEGKSVL
jgi:hypothetical protein